MSHAGVSNSLTRSAVTKLREETQATLATVKEEADRAVGEAKRLADEIEQRARLTATRISLKDAQQQFNQATTDLSKRISLWTWLTGLSVLTAVGSAFIFLAWDLPLASHDWPSGVYHTLVRLFILSTVAAITAFSLRILRAHLHLREMNQHRVRVANSVESFVNSAIEPQQRDIILAKLVEAIVDFGDSGLLPRGADERPSETISGETISRLVAAVSVRK